VTSLFEARRRLPTSATTFRLRRAGNQTRALDPRRDGGRNLLPFLDASSWPPLRERRRTASRATPVRSKLGVGSSRLPGFARPRSRFERATSDDLRRRSVVTIDVHGSLDRVKDVIRPDPSGSSPLGSGACALVGACRCRSPPRTPEDTLCPRCVRRQGRKPLPTVDHRPRPVFRRRPAKSAAIPRTGVPSTVTCFPRGPRDDCSSPLSRVGLPLTPPPLFPQAGESVEWGLASIAGRSPAFATFSSSGVRTPL
jgi:hypothetical protein